MKHLSLLAAASFFILTSCNNVFKEKVRGNGIIKLENRTAGQFNSVHVSGAIDVYVSQDSTSSIKVEADENLLQYVVIENENGELDIHQRDDVNLKATKSIKVYVSGPSFKYFGASGACDIYSENKISNTEKISIYLSGASTVKMELKAPQIDADLSGAGTITLNGETREFNVDGSGSTDINCFGLMTESTKVDLSGAGNAEVFASVKLDVHVSGAADVKYKGNATVSKDISGAGSVKKVD